MLYMSKLVVTGGEGFIGSKIVESLGAISYDLKSGEDILDSENLQDACEGTDGIFHCAAKISVPESFEKTEEYHRTNVEGTQSVIEAAELHTSKIIFSSSAAVYGESNKPVDESDPVRPFSPYAQNKHEGEMLLQAVSCPSVILRYFNVYGPGQSPAYAGVITSFIDAALNGENITIFGDGEQVRDFVYVDDVVQANTVAFQANIQNGEVFNIGSGTSVSINELAEEIIRLTNSSSRIVHVPAREGDIVYSQADVSKAKNVLNWSAQIGLREGLQKTIASFKGSKFLLNN